MRILVVRRDNIGDLVCTTPLISALRRSYPDAWIGAWVNSYNAPVLNGNPDLDEIVAYTKLKHLDSAQSAFAVLARRVGSLWRLRRMQLDYVLLATSDYSPRLHRLARWLAPRKIAGFADGSGGARSLDLSVPAAEVRGKHEVERVFALARLLGVKGEIPALKVIADRAEVEKARAAYGSDAKRKVAVHISARRPRQRWPAERFAALIERLRRSHAASIVLLWSPGPANHPQHPGDDEKAAEILQRLGNKDDVVAYPTERLETLIGALAASDAVVCSDGGALHLAAALAKPIACFFGDTSVERWHPWKVPHRVLHAASDNVANVTVEDALAACVSLFA